MCVQGLAAHQPHLAHLSSPHHPVWLHVHAALMNPRHVFYLTLVCSPQPPIRSASMAPPRLPEQLPAALPSSLALLPPALH